MMAKFWTFGKDNQEDVETPPQENEDSNSSTDEYINEEPEVSDPKFETEQDTEVEEAYNSEQVQDIPEAEKWKREYISLRAEFDNFRKRTRRDLEASRTAERVRVLSPLIQSLDNFERAFELEEAEDSPWIQGIKDCYQHLKQSFEQLGVVEIPAKGEPFNPDHHEAVGTMDSEEYDTQVVSEVVQKGYMLQDGTVIRYARVIVAN